MKNGVSAKICIENIYIILLRSIEVLFIPGH
jgi:hypothetical protein